MRIKVLITITQLLGKKGYFGKKKEKKSWIIPNIYNYHIKFSLLKKIIQKYLYFKKYFMT